MRTTWVLIAALAAGCGKGKPTTADPAPEAPGGSRERSAAGDPDLRGTWRVVAIEAAGKPVPKASVEKIQLDWVFEGDRVTTRRPDRADAPGTFAVDAATSPRRMTITKPGVPPIKAVYAVDGKTLKVCMTVDDDPGAGFPAGLASTAAPKADLLTLERR